MKPIRVRVAAIALSIAFGSVGGAGSTERVAKDQDVSGTDLFFQADGGR